MQIQINTWLRTCILTLLASHATPIFSAAAPDNHRALLAYISSNFDPEIIDDAQLSIEYKDALRALIFKITSRFHDIASTQLINSPGLQDNAANILNHLRTIHTLLTRPDNTQKLHEQKKMLEQQLQKKETALHKIPECAGINLMTITLDEIDQFLNTIDGSSPNKQKILNQFTGIKADKKNIYKKEEEIKRNPFINPLRKISSLLYEIEEMQRALHDYPDATIDCGLKISITLDKTTDSDKKLISYAAGHALKDNTPTHPNQYEIQQEFDVIILRTNDTGNQTIEIRECKDVQADTIAEHISSPERQKSVLAILTAVLQQDGGRAKIRFNRDFQALDALAHATISLHGSQHPTAASPFTEIARAAARTETPIHTGRRSITGHDATAATADTASTSPLKRKRTDRTPKKIQRFGARVHTTATPVPRDENGDESSSDDQESTRARKRARISEDAIYSIIVDPETATARLERIAEEMRNQNVSPRNIVVHGPEKLKAEVMRIFTPSPERNPTLFHALYVEMTPPDQTPPTLMPHQDLPFRPVTPAETMDGARTEKTTSESADIEGRMSRLSIAESPMPHPYSKTPAPAAATRRIDLGEGPANENGAANMDTDN